MINEQSVLVVNGQPETETVLKAVLEPRGFQINRVNNLIANQKSKPAQKPSLIVLHEESSSESKETSSSLLQDVPRVIIGSMLSSESSSHSATQRLSQPFQYGELIQAIEQLLEQ